MNRQRDHEDRPRRLADFHRLKTDPIEIPDPDVDGEFITVVMVKPNQTDSDSIDRRSAAARARYLAAVKDLDSDEYLNVVDKIAHMANEEIISLLVSKELGEKQLSIYLEVAARDEWSDEGYFLGLQEAWYAPPDDGGLSLQFIAASPPSEEGIEDPDDEADYQAKYDEAIRVRSEIDRFNGQVDAEVDRERDAAINVYVDWERERLEEIGIPSYIEHEGQFIFNRAQMQQKLYYCTRLAKKPSVRYHETALEVLELEDGLRERLRAELAIIEVPQLEGKDWPGTPGSSTPSEPSDAEDPSTSSGPGAASPSTTSPKSS